MGRATQEAFPAKREARKWGRQRWRRDFFFPRPTDAMVALIREWTASGGPGGAAGTSNGAHTPADHIGAAPPYASAVRDPRDGVTSQSSMHATEPAEGRSQAPAQDVGGAPAAQTAAPGSGVIFRATGAMDAAATA